jgi:hypothetical protein
VVSRSEHGGIYCKSECAADILKKRKGEGCYCSLAGRYLIESEIKHREFFVFSRDIIYFISRKIKTNVKIKKNTIHDNEHQTLYLVVTRLYACRADLKVRMTLPYDVIAWLLKTKALSTR